ncbi:MAG: Minf_1886 family protein [candidate division WOR-3 bacterium]
MRKKLEEILKKDRRYKLDAYLFLFEALDYTRKIFNKPKHVTGQELLMGIKELAKMKFGRLAKLVLEDWGVKTTDDFGEIVFNLVEAKLLMKTKEDKKEDFHNVYSFDEVFVRDYEISFNGK